MARVKVCRICGHHNTPDEFFCKGENDTCGTSLADVNAVDTSELERLAAEADAAEADAADDGGADGGGGAAGGGVDAGGVAGGDVDVGVGGQQNQAPNLGGQTRREAQVAPCALAFPWGQVPIAGQLNVGREAGFSPISGQLDAFPTVSRRHAVVGAAQGQWTVQDLGSTNGTYVNGTRLAANETQAIQNGDQIGFSQGLQVGVEISAMGGASGTPSY